MPKLRLWLAATLCLLAAQPRGLGAAALPEAQVKAAFIFNFLLFTDWPATTQPPPRLNLCLLGDDEVAKALRELDGRRLGASIVAVSGAQKSADLQACNAVYMAPQQLAHGMQWLASAPAQGVLSITDGGERLAGNGSILVVAIQHDRLVFDLDLEQAKRQRLGFSARVLQIAGKAPP